MALATLIGNTMQWWIYMLAPSIRLCKNSLCIHPMILYQFNFLKLILCPFHFEQNNGFSAELISPMIFIFWSIFPIFLFCNLGEDVSSEFAGLNNALYQGNWYTFPNEVQRIMPILLIATQQQVVPRGFGNLLCLRQFFSKSKERNLTFKPSKIMKWNCFWFWTI